MTLVLLAKLQKDKCIKQFINGMRLFKKKKLTILFRKEIKVQRIKYKRLRVFFHERIRLKWPKL